jgi:hypothetical protein
MGWNMAHIQLVPVKSDVEATTLQKWQTTSVQVTYDQSSETDDVIIVMGKAKPVIEDVLGKVQEGAIET